MSKKNQSLPVDLSTAQILHSLTHPEPIDSIEANIKKAIKKANRENEPESPTQDLKATAPTSVLPPQSATPYDDTITADDLHKALDKQFATLEKIYARVEKAEENKIRFKKCLHDLQNNASEKNTVEPGYSGIRFQK